MTLFSMVLGNGIIGAVLAAFGICVHNSNTQSVDWKVVIITTGLGTLWCLLCILIERMEK